MLEIIRWSGKHDPGTAAPKAFVDRIEHDRDAMVREVRAGLLQGRRMAPA
jgi:hypothetical protein